MGAPRRSFLGRLVRNTVVGFAGTLVLKSIGFVTTLVLARGFGQQAYGLYSYVLSYLFFFAFLSDLGMERVVTRELARAPQRAGEIIGNAVAVKLGLSLFALGAAVGVAWWIGLPAEARYCILVAGLGLPLSIELVLRGYFQARFEMGYSFAVTVPAAVASLLVAGVCVYLQLPVHALFYGSLVVGVLTVTALLRVASRQVRLVFRPRWRELLDLLRNAGEVGLFVLLFIAAMRLDQVMLFHLASAAEVGLYTVAVRATEPMMLVPEALLLSIFPLLAGAHPAASERFRHTYRLGFKYLIAMVIPVAIAFTMLRREIIALVFGAEYGGGATSLAILAWNMFFGYAGAIYLNLFIAQRWQRLLLVVSALTVVVNIACNLMWIPAYGAAGAAAATVVANGCGFACWCLIPLTRPYMWSCVGEMWKPVVAGAAAGVLCLLPLGPVPGVVMMLAGYGVMLWMLGGLDRADVALVRRLFSDEDPEPARA